MSKKSSFIQQRKLTYVKEVLGYSAEKTNVRQRNPQLFSRATSVAMRNRQSYNTSQTMLRHRTVLVTTQSSNCYDTDNALSVFRVVTAAVQRTVIHSSDGCSTDKGLLYGAVTAAVQRTVINSSDGCSTDKGLLYGAVTAAVQRTVIHSSDGCSTKDCYTEQ